MQLNQGQQKAIESALKFLLAPDEKYMVIKGPAGTGKSTLVQHLIPAMQKYLKTISIIMQSKTECPVLLTATTNKAAKVLAELTGEETNTIHTTLGLRVNSDFQTGETKLVRNRNSDVIEDSIILIDEAFFFCPALLNYLEQGTSNCKIIFIGDPFQCAPIRQTHSPIEDLVCRTEELTQVMRNNGILTDIGTHWRNVVRTGIFVPINFETSGVIDYVDGATFQALIEQEYSSNINDDITNKIICWTNNKSNQYSNFVRSLKGLPETFCEGEFLQINNSLPKQGFSTDSTIRIKKFLGASTQFGIKGRVSELYSGAELFIPDSPLEYQAKLKQYSMAKDWKNYYLVQESVPDLRAVHSCTVHKAQGSTYKNVFIDLPDVGKCNIPSDVARLMHVSVTRPTSRIIFRGNLPEKYGG